MNTAPLPGFLSFIQIFRGIQALVDDAIDFNRPVLRAVVKTDALLAVVADFRRIKIAEIALSALDALAVIQHTANPFHIPFPHLFLALPIIARPLGGFKHNMRTSV